MDRQTTVASPSASLAGLRGWCSDERRIPQPVRDCARGRQALVRAARLPRLASPCLTFGQAVLCRGGPCRRCSPSEAPIEYEWDYSSSNCRTNERPRVDPMAAVHVRAHTRRATRCGIASRGIVDHNRRRSPSKTATAGIHRQHRLEQLQQTAPVHRAASSMSPRRFRGAAAARSAYGIGRSPDRRCRSLLSNINGNQPWGASNASYRSERVVGLPAPARSLFVLHGRWTGKL